MTTADSGPQEDRRPERRERGDDGDRDAAASFDVPDMDCPTCAGKVESALDRVEGIRSRETRPTTGRVTVSYDEERVSQEDLVNAIEDAGYTPVGGEDEDAAPEMADGREIWTSKRGIKTWISGLFLAVGLAVEFLLVAWNAPVGSLLGTELFVADALFLLAVASGGRGTAG
jgi:Cd2+/Zn2+-exporting ATPase